MIICMESPAPPASGLDGGREGGAGGELSMWRNFIQTSQSLGTTVKLRAARRAGRFVSEELLGQDESRQLVRSVQN